MQQPEKELAIVIVTYNNADLINKQIECIKRFCKDDYDIIVIDNSDKPEVFESIRYHSTNMGAMHYKTQASSRNGSDSHAFACNFSYLQLKDKYRFFCYLDHDNFPIKEFSVRQILGEDKVMAGIGQYKAVSGKTYFWAGCVMWDNEKVGKHLIDFSTNNQLGLDTGGMLYRVIDVYSKDACVFFNEIYHQNPYFNSAMYNHYALIADGTFMHFVNSSNWNPTENNRDRINTLLNILEERINNNGNLKPEEPTTI